jgi:ATP-dependent RNA helicase DDX21
MENGHAAGESVKKSKKVKVMDPVGGDVAVAASPLAPESEKKKKKKEKKVEAEASNGHAVEAEASKSKKKRSKSPEDDGAAAKKIQKVVENGGKEAGAPVDPMAVSNFNICKVLRDKLKSKGIESLFPIQAQTFDAVFTGNDMVGRARTGQVGLRASFHGTVFQLFHFLAPISSELYVSSRWASV